MQAYLGQIVEKPRERPRSLKSCILALTASFEYLSHCYVFSALKHMEEVV